MRRLLVVSDLHLGDNGSLEDFTCDQAFADLLNEYGPKGPTELVLNGDIVDFLQVQPLGALTVDAAPLKLETIFSRHPLVMPALARFANRGNTITLIEGNHDIEFLFPKVREKFVELYTTAGGEAARLQYSKLSRVEYPHVHIEHGHQYDEVNSFDYGNLFTQETTGTLRLPWGSRFVLRVFNNVEPRFRFIDKVRPEKAAALLLFLLDRDLFVENAIPLLGLTVEGWLNQIRMDFLKRPTSGWIPKGETSELPWDVIDALNESLNDMMILEQTRTIDEALISKGAGGSAARRIIERLNSGWKSSLSKANSYDVRAAEQITKEGPAQFVIFGHTHHAGVKRFASGCHYINSGTWTPLLDFPYAKDTDQWLIDAMDAAKYPVTNSPTFVRVQIVEDSCNAELMTWNAARRCAEPAGY